MPVLAGDHARQRASRRLLRRINGQGVSLFSTPCPYFLSPAPGLSILTLKQTTPQSPATSGPPPRPKLGGFGPAEANHLANGPEFGGFGPAEAMHTTCGPKYGGFGPAEANHPTNGPGFGGFGPADTKHLANGPEFGGFGPGKAN